MNLYALVGSMPTRYVDPSGLFGFDFGAARRRRDSAWDDPNKSLDNAQRRGGTLRAGMAPKGISPEAAEDIGDTYMEGVSIAADVVSGPAKPLYELTQGVDPVTGNPVSTAQKVGTATALGLPVVGGVFNRLGRWVGRLCGRGHVDELADAARIGSKASKGAAERLPQFKGKSEHQIRKVLENAGFKRTHVSNSPGRNETWVHPDGSEVRIHPYGNVKQSPYKSANNAHVHKQDSLGNELNDRGIPSTTPADTHIGIPNPRDLPTVRGRPHGAGG
jgi:hypothetical protein